MITSVITKKGRILQNKQVNGATIKFTRVVAGSATTPIDELQDKISVSSVVQTLSIQSITQNENEQAYTILVLLENTNLGKSYSLNQIGFYASDPNEGEILFAIAQFDTPKKIETPSVEPGYTLEMRFKFQNSNDANIEIEFNPENLMSRQGVADMLKSEEISGKATGNCATVHDSTESPLLNVKLFGKCEQVKSNGNQLFNHEAEEFATFTAGGVVVRNNHDGTFTVSGEGTMTNTASRYYYYTHEESVKLFKAGMLNLKCSNITTPKVYIHPQINDKSLTTLTPGNLTEYELTEEHVNDSTFRVVLGIYANTGEKIVPGTFSVMLYQDGDGTLEPFTDGKPAPAPDNIKEITSVNNPTINLYSKNMCPMSAFDEMTLNNKQNTYDASTHKITMDEDTDGNNYAGRYCKPLGNNFKIGETYTLSFDIKGTRDRKVSCGWDWCRKEIVLTDSFVRYKITKVADRVGEVVSFYTIATAKGGLAAGEYMQFDNVQICVGDDGVFEEHKAVQTITVDTPNGLRGIPVPSGGNYTDENGQSWLCDEINLAKRKYIQRVNTITFDGSEGNWSINTYDLNSLGVYIFGHNISDIVHEVYDNPLICDKLQYQSWGYLTAGNRNKIYSTPNYVQVFLEDQSITTGEAFAEWLGANPITVVYPLAEPIETDLTEEQIALFETLKANEGTTSIFMDGIGNMEVTYFKDTDNGKAMGILKSEHIYLKKLIGDVNAVVKGLVG